MKKVLVTGASGFIGSVLVRRLLTRGDQVAVLRRGSAIGARLRDIEQHLRPIKTDDSGLPSIESLRDWAPNIVFHLGWAGVSSSQRNDAENQLQNVNYAAQLAQLCVRAQIKCFVGAGSQAEYGPKSAEIFETDCPAPTTLYGAAKLSAMVLTQRICQLEGVAHAWLRVFSTYGPGDNPDWLIPSLVTSLRNGVRPQLTAGEQYWDFLHVEDAAEAFIKIGDCQASGIFNLASGEAVQLRNVICMVRDIVRPDAHLGFGELPYRPDQVMRLHGNIDRLVTATGWRPQIPLAVGLRMLCEDHRSCQMS